MNSERIEKAKNIFITKGPILKTSTLNRNRLSSRDISELVNLRVIEKLKTGYYLFKENSYDISDIDIVSSIIPEGVISMFSAAEYYDLTTVIPTSVNITVSKTGELPVLPKYPPVHIHRTAQKFYGIGITEIFIQNGKILIYDKERTVCDFFRMRNKYGNDIAFEVFRNYMAGKKNIQKLLEYAGQLRIRSVIKPYIEVLI